MTYKKSVILLILAVFIISTSCVCASDAAMAGEDNTYIRQTIETADGEILSASDDETVSAERDSQTLTADQYNYNDLRNQFVSGGDINLTKGNYTYVSGDGDTIEISTSGVINGNGAVIDMDGSTIRAFKVTASGVTIKNLTIKNANYNGNGGAIYFIESGTVENCNFTDNHVTGNNIRGGAIMFLSTGTVTNCKFTGNNATGPNSWGGAVFFSINGNVTNCNFVDNTATYGGAVYFVNTGTVTNCNFTGNTATYDGGAVYFFDTGEVKNCNFTDNQASHWGGAVYFNNYGNVTNCNFTGNTATYYGGAVYFNRNGEVTNCNFTGNTATGDGGAVFFNGKGDVTNCNFTNNKATGIESWGGAIRMSSGTVTNCNFTNNTATSNGGAFFSDKGDVTNCNFTGNTATGSNSCGGAIRMNSGTVSNCNFTGNKATGTNSWGGAVYFNSDGDVRNCNFTNNSASNCGGAVFCNYQGDVKNCNFTNNTAYYGGAVYFLYTGNVSNCNFTGNNATTGSAIYFYKFYSSNTLTVSDSTFLNNRANAEALDIVKNDNNITITFTGRNNLLNAIYSPDEVTFTNVTYWGANGITNTGKVTTKPSRSNKEAGQKITVEIHDSNDNLVENVTYVTDDNGQVTYDFIKLSNGDYKYKAYHSQDCYYTYAKYNDTFTLESDLGDFNRLQKYINGAGENSVITLCRNYTFTIGSDENLAGGIVIDKQLTIKGNGYTINAKGKSRIFYVTAGSINITNVTLKNGKASAGGAIYFKNAISNSNINATFINNTANGQDIFDGGGANYFRGIVSGLNIGGTYTGNTANGQGSYNGGGANYFRGSVSGSNIGGTYTGNNATIGGANYFGSVSGSNIGGTYTGNNAINGGANSFLSVSGSKVTGTYIGNNATNSGGANYFNVRVLDSNIGGTYTGNNAINGGANYFEVSVISSNVTGIYINNTALKSIIHAQNYFDMIGSDVEITYAIFLNNKCEYEIYASTQCIVVNDSWFGNNASNFMNPLRTFNVQVDSWLFLNATADPNSISVFDSSDILFKLYSTNGTHISEYDNSKLPVVNLTLTATNGEVSNSTTLDKSVEYRAIQAGQGSITASVEDAEYTIFLDNIGLDVDLDVAVNPQVIDYGENAAVILEYNATATGTVNITLKGKKHNQTIENVVLNKTITLPDAILPDEYEVTVSYFGDDIFANASASSTLSVNQLKSDIKVVGYDIYVNDTNGLIFTATLPENTTGNITINNTIILSVTKEGRKENNSLIIEIMNDAYPVGQYNWTFTYSGDDVYGNSEANAASNILIIPTEITANATSSLFVDDTDQVTYNLTPENAVGDVRFTSNDTSVVEVNQNGNIKAIAEGTAIITVTFEGSKNYTASSTNVTVTVSKIATEITLTNATVELKAYKSIGNLTKLDPAGAGNLTYTSSDEDIVLVSEDGIIYARIKGTATVIVSFAGDNKYKAAENKTITVTVTLNDASVSTENDTIDLYVDDTCIINATANPHFLAVYYTSSNESVASVTEYGNVNAVGEGTAVITLTVGNGETYAINTTNVTVTVSKVPTEIKIDSPIGEMSAGAMGHVAAELIPSEAGKLSYASNDTSVATVSSTGVIKANKAGTALITVSFAGDDKYAAAENKTITLTVNLNDASISVNNSTLELLVDDNFTIVATTVPAGLNVTYVPDDSGVVSVDNKGVVTALKEGTASITVKIGGDGVYVENSTIVTVTVSKIPTEIIVQNATVDMKVTDEVTPVVSMMPSGAGELDFTSSDVSVVTVNGIGTITAVGEGIANVTVRFIGNDKYLAAESKNITVTVSLKDASVSVNNSTIDLFIDDNFTIVATTTPEGLNVTYVPDNSGVISVDENGVVTALKEGNANIIVKVGGDGTYVENSTAITVTVNKQDANLDVSLPENVTVGDNSTVNVKLPSDATGNVTVKVDDTVVSTVPVTDGTASVKLPKLSAGNHTVEIAYSGDDKYKSSSKTATISVDKDSTKLTANNVTATYKVKKYLTITLTDSQGSPIANATVSVELKSLKNYTTDANGQVKVKVSSLVPKTYTAKITFKGDDKYIGSNTTAKVVVKKASSKITAKAKTFKTTAKNKKYTVTLKANGKALKNKWVYLKVNGVTYKAKTNSKGKATFNLKKLAKTGTAKITYKGNDYYKKTTKKVKLTVKSVFKTISKGSKNHEIVKKIQRALKNHGYYLVYNGHYLKVDGIFWDYTEMAVKEFQHDKKLKVTGKVDEKTAKKLGII